MTSAIRLPNRNCDIRVLNESSRCPHIASSYHYTGIQQVGDGAGISMEQGIHCTKPL